MTDYKLYWRGWSEDQLAAYQGNQGTSNHCAKYAAASGLNMLFGIVLTGDDLVDWVAARPFKGTGAYTIFGNNHGSLVYQTTNLVRALGRQAGLPIDVKNRRWEISDLLDTLQNGNALSLITLTYFKDQEPVIAKGENANSSLGPTDWAGGHILIPAAYDPDHTNTAGQGTPWGFLSSWGAVDQLYWMTDKAFQSSWGRFSLYNSVSIHRTDV
jgi:hypothetical protein